MAGSCHLQSWFSAKKASTAGRGVGMEFRVWRERILWVKQGGGDGEEEKLLPV